jgi:hypothetical protein
MSDKPPAGIAPQPTRGDFGVVSQSVSGIPWAYSSSNVSVKLSAASNRLPLLNPTDPVVVTSVERSSSLQGSAGGSQADGSQH